jgi:putative transposase
MAAAEELSGLVGTGRACEALSLPRSGLYRQRRGRPERAEAKRRRSHRALSAAEQQAVLETLHSERFRDKAPAEIYATLCDEGLYLASVRTMYRLLEQHGEVRERRDVLRHPPHARPELVATGPDRVWTWDITKLLGPAKWVYYHLYVVIDIYSRLVVGWMVAPRETAELAKRLLEESCRKHDIQPGQLVIHADRGTSMKSKPVALLLADLGVTKTHSRPRVSNDNPYSESQFKTLKYCPEFPEKFDSIEHARSFCAEFFPSYNHEHHHSGLHLLTPAQVHSGQAEAVLAERHRVLLSAYEAHPERFLRGAPQPKALPKEVWINRPERALALEEGSCSSEPQFSSQPPLTAAGAAERKTAEARPLSASTDAQRSEPQFARRTRREAGDVTGRNEQDQRLGAAPAAGGGTGAVPASATSPRARLDRRHTRMHHPGGAAIEPVPA